MGGVKIGDSNFIGINSSIKQYLNIGNDNIIGAGTNLVNDVLNNKLVVGNPGCAVDKRLDKKVFT